LIVFQNGHISGALAELIRSTRAPIKDRLIGKIMGGNPVFRGTRVPVHRLAELVPSCVRTRCRRGSVGGTLIAVGGGAFLVPDRLAGISEVVRVPHGDCANGDCANAVGAATAQISGETDQVEKRREP
jgi:hypothetical protein